MASPTSINLADVEPESYLQVAMGLARSANGTQQRSAGDRAYYAAYLYCRRRMVEQGYSANSDYSGRGGHTNLTADVKDKLGETIGQKEDMLRRLRNALTYSPEGLALRLRTERIPLDITMDNIMDMAREIIEAAKNLPPASQRPSIGTQ